MSSERERVETVEIRVSGDASPVAVAPADQGAPGRPRLTALAALARERAYALRLEARRRRVALGTVAVAARGRVAEQPGRPPREVALEVRIVTGAPVDQVRELARAVEARAAGTGLAPPATLEIVAVTPEPARRWRAAGGR